MKYLITTIAAVMLVGCGESQSPDMRLIQSIKDKDINATKNAFSDGADVNANMGLDWDERRPLHQAVGSWRMGIAELLIAEAADVNEKDNREYTSLHFAVTHTYKEMVEMLIEKGADVNAMTIGFTPLELAEEVDEDNSPEDKAVKKEISDLLRKNGAKTAKELKAEGK